MGRAITPLEDQLSGAPGDQRRRRRRRFAAQLVPGCVVLLVVGAMWADEGGGALGAAATVTLAQGIGLAVASAWLSLGHNPLDRR